MATTVLTEVYAKLQSKEPGARRNGLHVLTELVARGDAHAISTTVSCLEDCDHSVRELALQVLGKLPPASHRVATDEVITLLGHSSPDVRSTALQTLRKIAPAGDEIIMGAVTTHLHHENLDVCRIALQALHHLDRRGIRTKIGVIQLMLRSSQKGNHDSILALVKHLEDDDIEVRNAAVVALGEFVEKGDAFAISSLRFGLQHHNPLIRCSVIQALANIVEAGDASSMDFLLSCADDPDSRAWCALMSRLRDMLGDEDDRILALVQRRLAHADLDARCDAIRTLFTVFTPDHEGILSLLVACLEDKNVDIQFAATDAMASVDKGNHRIFQAVSSHLEHPDPTVRCAAVHTLGQISEKGDENTFKILCKYLRNSDCDVVSAVVSELRGLEVESELVVGILKEHMVMSGVGSKLVVAEALGQIASEKDEHATAAFLALLHDADADVRRLAVQSLAVRAESGDRVVFAEISKCLEDTDAIVRRAAVHASIWCAGDVLRSALGEALARGIRVEVSLPSSQRGDQIQKYLKDEAGLQVRLAVIRAFPMVLAKDDESTIRLCHEYLGDDDASVRCAAVEAMAQLNGENRQFIHCLTSLLQEDEDLGVKVSILHALIEVAPRDDAKVIEAVRSCNADDNSDVKNVVQLALTKLSSKSTEHKEDSVSETKACKRVCLQS